MAIIFKSSQDVALLSSVKPVLAGLVVSGELKNIHVPTLVIGPPEAFGVISADDAAVWVTFIVILRNVICGNYL